MMDIEQKLFRTPQDALIFAFNYSMQQQGRSGMALLGAPSLRTGKGLSGNDGAGQAGMIRSELGVLSELERAIIAVRFAPKMVPCNCRNACCRGYSINPEWNEGIRVIEQAALALFSGHVSNYRLRRRLVEKAMGEKIELKEIAREAGVTENTVGAHWKIIKEWLLGRSKPRHVKGGERSRVAEADGLHGADVAIDSDNADAQSAVDGVVSLARKHADNVLSHLSFIGTHQ